MRKHRFFSPVILIVLAAARVAAQQPSPSPSASPRVPKLAEEITVSASVAGERDAASFASLDRDGVQNRNRGQDLAMLLAETPNAYAYSDAGNGVGYAYLSLRGFDQRRIAVYVNGVPLNEPESQQVYFIDVADLASGLSEIQVQRGTGTSLYGSPSVGGSVNLETGALPPIRHGEAVLGAASFGTFRGSIQYAFPFDAGRSVLSARVAHVRSDGYRQPAFTRHSLVDLGYQKTGQRSVLRVKLFGGPEETQLAYLGVPIANLRGELSGNPDVDRRQNPLREGETDTFFQPQLQVLHDVKLKDGLLLKNTLYAIAGDGYFKQYRASLSYDPLGPEPPTPAFPEKQILQAWRRREISQRRMGWVPSLAFETGKSRLVAGFEVLHHGGRHFGSVSDGFDCSGTTTAARCLSPTQKLTTPLPLYDYIDRKTTLGAFARETWSVTPRLRLSAELQATQHEFRMREDVVRGYSWDSGYGFVTPRLGVSFDASARVNLYATLSTARSEPRFDDIWNPQDVYQNPVVLFDRYDPQTRRLSDAKASPERLQAAEAGVTFKSANASLRANGYWMDFRDELVFAGGIDEDGLPITDNAARSLHRGAELELSLRLPGGLALTANGSVSEDRLQEYVLRYGPSPADSVDYSGNRVALFPSRLARARVSRAFGPLLAAFVVRHVGRIFLDNSEDERKNPAARAAPGYVPKTIEPFTLWEAELQLDLGRWLKRGGRTTLLRISADNLFDERYTASGYVDDQPYFVPAATRNIYVGLRVGF